jgi:hypothetical protein
VTHSPGEALHRTGILRVDRDTENDDVRVAPVELSDLGNLPDAGYAPRGPEVQYHPVALRALEAVARALRVGEIERERPLRQGKARYQ